MISAFGAANALFGKDKPRLKQFEVVKNRELQKILDPAITRTGGSMELMDDEISQFRDLFAKQAPEFERFTREGLGQFEDILGGRFEQQLRGLREREASARTDATESAMRRLTGADQARRSRLGVTGGNSFLDTLKARLMRDTETESALAGTAQERADFGTLKQLQMGTIGQRENLLNALAQRGLTRAGVEAGAQGPTLNILSALQQMDEANKHRGLYKKRSTLDRLSDFENVVNTDIQNIVGMVGDVMPIAGALCWVARAAYFPDDIRWRMFRRWLLLEAPVEFVKLYLVAGREMARMVERNQTLRMAVRSWMNRRI